MWDNRKPTVQMLGRYQPWHDGHTALFKRALAKTGQVCIMVRDTAGIDEKNPFDFDQIKKRILDKLYEHGYRNNVDFVVQLVPNIVDITYGRDVGYTITKETLDADIEAISATKQREMLRQAK